jgi:guanylate kinase
MKPLLIVISGPSGVGKQTIANELKLIIPDMRLSISATTRSPRFNEKDGIDYYFFKKKDFLNKIKSNYFIEYAEVHDNLYGTPIDNIKNALSEKYLLLMVIDINGGKSVKKVYPGDSLLFFIKPPNFSDLEERLLKRGSENNKEIKMRLLTAKVELSNHSYYDYIIINDDPKRAALEIKSLIFRRDISED